MKSPKERALACPCESGKPYSACCEPHHLGQRAPNAEALMRSRYTAYALGLDAYILATWHPDTRPAHLNLTDEELTAEDLTDENLTPEPPLKWIGLTVERFEQTSETTATVAFVARYKLHGKAERLCEVSQFSLLDRWYYVTGTHD